MNICCFLKASTNKILYFKVNFLKEKIIMQIKYKGKTINPRSYCEKTKFMFKKGWLFNTVIITLNCKSIKTKQPPKINLDGCLKNRLSTVYITLALSGLKRFN